MQDSRLCGSFAIYESIHEAKQHAIHILLSHTEQKYNFQLFLDCNCYWPEVNVQFSAAVITRAWFLVLDPKTSNVGCHGVMVLKQANIATLSTCPLCKYTGDADGDKEAVLRDFYILHTTCIYMCTRTSYGCDVFVCIKQ